MLRQDGSAEFIENFVPNVVGPDAPEPVRARLRELAARQSPDAMADAMEAMAARADTSGVLRALAVPALVICGEFDKGAPPALHAEMAALIVVLSCPTYAITSACNQPVVHHRGQGRPAGGGPA